MSIKNETQDLKSVGIVGDGDDVELIEAFESTFKISFSNEEAESMSTLGQAFEAICSKLPTTQSQQNKCLTAMAYYRLNRALCDDGKIDLGTRVKVPHGQSPKSFQKQLERRADLKLHFLTGTSTRTTILFFFQFVSWMVAPVMLSGSSAFLGAVVIAAGSHILWRFADSSDERVWVFNGTLGDLSRQASETNFGKLVSLGGTWKEPDVWKIMTSIIHDYTGFPPDNMTPEMKFI